MFALTRLQPTRLGHHAEPVPSVSISADLGHSPGIQEVATFSVDIAGPYQQYHHLRCARHDHQCGRWRVSASVRTSHLFVPSQRHHLRRSLGHGVVSRTCRCLSSKTRRRLASTLSIGLRAEGFLVVDVAQRRGRAVAGHRGRLRRHRARHHAARAQRLRGVRQLREREIWTPVLMLTAKDGDYDQTDAFDLGADDYLTKPFSFIVLVARLRALIRRGAPQRPRCSPRATLSLDPARRVVHAATTSISLTPREYGLLEFLMRTKDTVVTKTEILENVWDAHYERCPTTSSRCTSATCAARSTSRSAPHHRDRPRCRLPLESGAYAAAAEPSPACRRPAGVIDDAAVVRRDDLPDDRQAEPGPPALRDRLASSRTKRSKTRSRSAGGMPGPSSSTMSTRAAPHAWRGD